MEERHRPGCVASVKRLMGELGYRSLKFDGRSLVPDSYGGSNNYLFLAPSHVDELVAAGLGIAT